MTMIEKIAAVTLVAIIIVVITQLFVSGGEGDPAADKELSATRNEAIPVAGFGLGETSLPPSNPRTEAVDVDSVIGGAQQKPGEREEDKPTAPEPKLEDSAIVWEGYKVQRNDSWARLFKRRYEGQYLSPAYNLWHKLVVSEPRNLALLKGSADLREGQSLWLPSQASFATTASTQLGPTRASGASADKVAAAASVQSPADNGKSNVVSGPKPPPRPTDSEVMGGLVDVRVTGFINGTATAPSGTGAAERIHVVAPGESPATISRKHFQTERHAQAIMDLNEIKDPKTLRIGQRLKIPNL